MKKGNFVVEVEAINSRIFYNNYTLKFFYRKFPKKE